MQCPILCLQCQCYRQALPEPPSEVPGNEAGTQEALTPIDSEGKSLQVLDKLSCPDSNSKFDLMRYRSSKNTLDLTARCYPPTNQSKAGWTSLLATPSPHNTITQTNSSDLYRFIITPTTILLDHLFLLFSITKLSSVLRSLSLSLLQESLWVLHPIPSPGSTSSPPTLLQNHSQALLHHTTITQTSLNHYTSSLHTHHTPPSPHHHTSTC
ncbi:hypothetical protein PGT21_009747 [Puccinia graminis f. sp. tritici]|uniref:Uncharacterized protein n=1 Tax=Puccinia graminis f. sp. tritici TaxID=56615 RepID=A0A5B0NMP7_PUCGR|nr:hypothetical protein PGT21_009747 [Puccinia graminis f. sp. tritici]